MLTSCCLVAGHLLLDLRQVRRVRVPGGRVHVSGVRQRAPAKQQPHGLLHAAARVHVAAEHVGRRTCQRRRHRHHDHVVRVRRVLPLREHARHHGEWPRAVLRAARRLVPLLRHDVLHGGQAVAGDVRLPTRRSRHVAQHVLRGAADENQSHFTHLQSRDDVEEEPELHESAVADRDLYDAGGRADRRRMRVARRRVPRHHDSLPEP